MDLSSDATREELAAASYYRERREDMALDEEHHLEEATEYMCLSWDSLSAFSQRPYRVAVAEVCDRIAATVSET